MTSDPELRSTQSGKTVCSFSVAVNRKKKIEGQPDADFFRVSAWNALGENCNKFLSKGKKVAVTGSVSVHTYDSNGKTRASLEVMATDVEFLSPKSDSVDRESGMQKVDPADNPFKAQQTSMEETPW